MDYITLARGSNVLSSMQQEVCKCVIIHINGRLLLLYSMLTFAEHLSLAPARPS
jgi:hypothetical protein